MSFIGNIPLGAALLCVCVVALVLPSIFVRGADPLDLVFTTVVVACVVWLVLRHLRRRFFTPPVTTEGLADRRPPRQATASVMPRQ